MLAFCDRGEQGSGEALAAMLRPGSAGSNSAADHIAVLDAALAQLPEDARARVLVRTDTGGGVKESLQALLAVVSKGVLSWRFNVIRHHPKPSRVADSPTKHRPQISVCYPF